MTLDKAIEKLNANRFGTRAQENVCAAARVKRNKYKGIKMKVIGNRNGTWLVGSDVDETSDEYQCEVVSTEVIVTGDPGSKCTVEIPTVEGHMSGQFINSELVGKWEYRY